MKTAKFLMAAGGAGKVGERLRHTPWKSELWAERRWPGGGLDAGPGHRDQNIFRWLQIKIYHTVNRLRSFLSFSHSVNWSFSHLVTLSFSHSVIQSLGHLVTWSLGHSISWSLGNLVTRSLITQSLGHKSLFLYFQHCDWQTDGRTKNIRIYRSASQTTIQSNKHNKCYQPSATVHCTAHKCFLVLFAVAVLHDQW